MTLIAFVVIALSASAAYAGDPASDHSGLDRHADFAGYSWSSGRYSDDNYLSGSRPEWFHRRLHHQLPNRVVSIEADIVGSGMDGSDGQRYLRIHPSR